MWSESGVSKRPFVQNMVEAFTYWNSFMPNLGVFEGKLQSEFAVEKSGQTCDPVLETTLDYTTLKNVCFACKMPVPS